MVLVELAQIRSVALVQEAKLDDYAVTEAVKRVVAKAIAQLSVFAEANREVVESIEVNPLLVRPGGRGVVAVDAHIVTKDRETR